MFVLDIFYIGLCEFVQSGKDRSPFLLTRVTQKRLSFFLTILDLETWLQTTAYCTDNDFTSISCTYKQTTYLYLASRNLCCMEKCGMKTCSQFWQKIHLHHAFSCPVSSQLLLISSAASICDIFSWFYWNFVKLASLPWVTVTTSVSGVWPSS